MRRFRVIVLGVMISWVLSSGIGLGAAWWSKRLTNNAGSSWSPAIALDGSNVYVVWNDDTPGNDEIHFRKSADGGATWQAAKRLTYTAADSIIPAIAVNGLSIYVVWGEYDVDTLGDEIYFKKSVDGGITWQAARRLTFSTDETYYPDIGVAIAVNSFNIYVAWHDDTPGNNEIHFRKSVDGGANWQAAKRLTFNSGWSEKPSLAVSGSNVYVAWHDDTPGKPEIYYRKSVDGGGTWQAAKRLTYNSGLSRRPAIAVSGTNVYMAWDDGTPGNNEIFFRKSADGGGTWQASKRLTYTTGNSYCPALAVNQSIIYGAWYDDTPGNNEIYFKRSGDGGANWEAIQRLTFTGGGSHNPAVALNNSIICVVWDDDTPGNYEIYLKYSGGSF